MAKTKTQKIPVKKILRELGKLKEYHYPRIDCSLFILPDGRMVGTYNPQDHYPILEKIIKRKIKSLEDALDIIMATKCIRIVIATKPTLSLFVDIMVNPTTEQKYTLEALGTCDKYNNITVQNFHEYIPDAPTQNYCRYLLKLPFQP